MHTALTDPSQASPEWLTQTLRDAGALPTGQVAQVAVLAEPSYTSTIARLTATYSDDAPAGAPSRLFLKLARLDSQQSAVGSAQRRREVEFHNRVAALMPGTTSVVVRCYQAVYDEATGACHLLFDDVSRTHFGGKSTCPPDRPACESAIDAFAALHAFWWDHPALAGVSDLPVEASVASEIEGIGQHFPRFADFLGDRLSAHWRRVYDRVIDALPGLLQRVTRRVTRGNHLTLIHGDANLSNVMMPRVAGAGPAFIIDWQMWGVSYAAEDLSNLMALFWSHEARAALERDLLARYHRRLVELGVTGYAWADCWRDYRLAIITRILFMPMWFWVTGAAENDVYASQARVMQAFDDLGCIELLAT